jgi:hypothetical protein
MRGLDGIDPTEPVSNDRMCERCGARGPAAPLRTWQMGIVLLCPPCTTVIKEVTDDN